jgi:UDP-glucose 4-epimerase
MPPSGVLIAAKEARVRRVIYSASSAAYGNVTEQHISETSLPAPISPYGVAKLVGEYYCKAFYASYGLEAHQLTLLQYFWLSARPQLRLCRRDPQVHHHHAQRKTPHYFWGWASNP